MHVSLTTSWFQNNHTFADLCHQKAPEIRQLKNGIIVTSPAKINLYLRIKGKLPHRLHSIETIYGGITLCDTITICKTKNPTVKLYCNIKQIQKHNNTVTKVVNYLLKKYSIAKTGLKIYLQKNIPIGSGLGGANSNAAFVYLAFHKLFNIPINNKVAIKDLEEFGTDTLYFLSGGTAYGRGLPDIIKHIDINKFIKKKGLHYPDTKFYKSTYILLLYPFIIKKTKTMYAEYDKYIKGKYIRVKNFLHNDFKDMLYNKCKKIKIILDIIKDMGYSEYCNISGSGSTIYILLKNHEEVMKVWRNIGRKTELKISGACGKFTKAWKNIFN